MRFCSLMVRPEPEGVCGRELGEYAETGGENS